VVTSVDGRPLTDAAGLTYAMNNHRPGESVRIGVRRSGGGEPQLTVRAEVAPATPARDERTIVGRNPFEGATVVNLSPAVAEELGVDPFAGPGVLVTALGRGAAMNVGVRPGDIIRVVNGRQIRSVRDLVGAVSGTAPAWQVTIERNGQQVTATFRA
jgi:S1-C subfamily serine protease